MQIVLTARNKENSNEEYILLENEGLQKKIDIKEGNGSLLNPYRVQLTISNRTGKNWEGVIHIAFHFNKKNPRFFLPGFMYGRNRGEAPLEVVGEFPRIREGEMRRPASPWWMVRSDRLSHPAAFVYDQGMMYGLSASPYFVMVNNKKTAWNPGVKGEFFQYTGFTCSLEKVSIGYTLGYENAPWLFVESHNVKERMPLGQNCFVIQSGEEIKFEMFMYEYEAEDERSIYDATQAVYELYHEKPRTAGDIHTTVSDIAYAIYNDAWIEEDKNYSGFVFDRPDGSFRYFKLSSISWTNGLAVAVPMLLSAYRLKDENMRNQALACIENIVKFSINPDSGLPYETFSEGRWSNRGWWFDRMHTPGHSSYLIGQALYYTLKAYDYEKREKNCDHPEWLEFVRNVILKIERTKNADYEYPYIFSEKTGAGLEYDSMAGAWCMAATAYYSLIVQDDAFLDDLKKSELHYYNSFIKKAECYGCPLDTDKAIDSEGVLAYIRAVRKMHKLTGEKLYLKHLRDALYYEFTFKFCYNSPIKTPPLSKIGWSSCGGSITSVANPHIHPMSSSIMDEMFYYLKQEKDAYVESRLKDTIMWSCQTHNRFDKEYDYGRKGWMSERFCHSEGLLVEKYPDGSPSSTWFALMPWAGSCILEGLCGGSFFTSNG